MKTLEDYYHQTLGLSLKIPTQKKSTNQTDNIKTEKLQKPSQENFHFIAASEDFKNNQEMVLKILKSINKNKEILKTSDELSKLKGTVFNFGLALEPQNSEALVKSWPSFSEISESIDLKRQLWDELKKHS